VQAARLLLDNLVSELNVTTINLPLATYPAAIKEAVRLIDADKPQAARQVLMAALSTLVIEKQATPLPLIYAESIVEVAADIAGDESKADAAIAMLADARYQLQLAEALGYGEQDEEFAAIRDDIETLEEQIEERRETSGPFDRLKIRLGRFSDRISE
jgi:hypothetical protein